MIPRNECLCSCHTNPDVRHIMPCCDTTPLQNTEIPVARTFLFYLIHPRTGTAYYIEIVNGYLVGSHDTETLMREMPGILKGAL